MFYVGQHLHGVRHHHSHGRLWFDLSEITNETTVMSAELRLYLNMTTHEGIDDGESEWKTNDRDQLFSITLYEIKLADALVYVESVEVQRNQKGWISFNVTVPLRHWLIKPEENFGLQLVYRSSISGYT